MRITTGARAVQSASHLVLRTERSTRSPPPARKNSSQWSLSGSQLTRTLSTRRTRQKHRIERTHSTLTSRTLSGKSQHVRIFRTMSLRMFQRDLVVVMRLHKPASEDSKKWSRMFRQRTHLRAQTCLLTTFDFFRTCAPSPSQHKVYHLVSAMKYKSVSQWDHPVLSPSHCNSLCQSLRQCNLDCSFHLLHCNLFLLSRASRPHCGPLLFHCLPHRTLSSLLRPRFLRPRLTLPTPSEDQELKHELGAHPSDILEAP